MSTGATVLERYLETPCKVCGLKLGDHTAQRLQVCWFYKELVAYDPIARLTP